MQELVRYQRGQDSYVVSRDGEDLVFLCGYEDFGRWNTSETRIRVADFVACGEGPWPWYDLGDKREGTLLVLEALGRSPQRWVDPLPRDALELFKRAACGDASIADVLPGVNPDPVDACGATPLWYALRSSSPGVAVALIDAGADSGRRIGLSAHGDRFTTTLHEIVRVGATVALTHALARGVDPSVLDSDGATPMHVVDEHRDNVNPEIVRALAGAGAAVDAAMPSGTQPVETAARRLLPATVSALVGLGASAGRGLDALLTWWPLGSQYARHRAGDVAALVEILRAGGAEVTERHVEQASRAGASQVESALRS